MKKTLIALMALAGVAMGDTYWSFEGTLDSAGDNTYRGATTGDVTMVNITTTTGDVLGDASTNNLGYAMSIVDGSYIYYGNADIVSSLKYAATGATESYTLMSYVKFNTVTGEQFFFGTGSGSDMAGIALGIKDGKVDFLEKTVNHKTFDYTLTANTWYHLAFAYDHTTNAVGLFVNGESKGSITLDSSLTSNIARSELDSGLYIGAASGITAQDDFAGQVAHLQIITGEALGADAVKQYASTIIPEPATATLSLLALAGLAARRRRK